MTRLKLFYVTCVVLLFLGWLPKLEGDGVPWYLDNDFAHFYLTGLLTRGGHNPYGVALGPLYEAMGFNPSRSIPEAGAPPALAVLMIPFTSYSPKIAFIMWTALQVGAFLLGLVMLARHLKLRLSPISFIFMLLGSLAPFGVLSHLRYGQVQCLMFFLVVLGVLGIERQGRWLWRLGLVCWGVSVSLKLFTLPLVYVAWRYRGLAGVFWFCVGCVVLLLPFGVLCGSEGLVSYVYSTLPYVQGLANSFSANISLSGMSVNLQRILLDHDVFSPATLQRACALLLIPLVVVDWRSPPDLIASTFTMLVTACLLSPTTWPHYLPLLAGVFLYLVKQALAHPRSIEQLWSVAVLYACTGAVLGRLAPADRITQVVSSVWGPVCMLAMLYLLGRARARSRPELA